MKFIYFTAIIIMALAGPLFSQNITIDQNEVTVTIKIQVEGLVSGADTVFVTLPPDTVLVRADTVFVPQIEYITLPQDTTYITRIDTFYVDRIDTVTVTQIDTVFTTVTDTLYVDRVDTLFIPRIDTLYVHLPQDTLFVPQIDTVYATVYDTLYYPVHRGTEVAFSDVPPDHRRLERIIVRPIGWATGTVAIKGSDDPWWTDIAINVSTGDIWGIGDYMMYINIPTRDWSYAYAMLDSLQAQDRRGRTGLHIRQSYEPGSPFVFLAYQDGRANVNMRNEWGGEVVGHPDGGFAVDLPVLLQVNMTELGFDARLYDVWTDSLLHSWELPNFFTDKFYTGIATTSWRTDYITRAWYSLLNIVDADPWYTPCRDGDGNIIEC